MTNKTTLRDMELIREHAYSFISDAGKVPITFKYNGKQFKGIPASYNPKTKRKMIDANIVETVFEGTDPETGLNIRVECYEYRDYPVVEWTAYFTNTSSKNTPIIGDLYGCECFFSGSEIILHENNGDFYSPEGYQTTLYPVNEGTEYTFKPNGGRCCDGAFPYDRVMCKGFGYNIITGWPGQWKSYYTGVKGGFEFGTKQEYTRFYLKPDETFRTPRITIMAFDGDETRGINVWRRFYLAHVMPRTRGNMLEPKSITHVSGGGEEFTLADENNQIRGITTYLERGLNFDIWWIDAGWYPCKDENGVKRWTRTGNWIPDPEKFPNGLYPVGKCCNDNNIQLLVWFEPERIILDYWPKDMPQDFLLKRTYIDDKGEKCFDQTALLDLGTPKVREWITALVNKTISESNIKIYRQDFNMPPLEWWLQNETEERRGTKENFHIQAYLQYWDDLLFNNPDLWIDSCASGGRRNDMETMRRSVPLQYTDYGINEHTIKESFNYAMFQWMPYFRNHTVSGDDIDGNYNTDKPKKSHDNDNYAYQSAMCPSITCMVSPFDTTDTFDYSIKMNSIWQKTAGYMLEGDYYALLPYSKEKDSWYSVQFHVDDKDEGIIQGIRNLKCPIESMIVHPKCFCDLKTYVFQSPEFCKTIEISGKDINDNGFAFKLPIRSGEVWFYHAKR